MIFITTRSYNFDNDHMYIFQFTALEIEVYTDWVFDLFEFILYKGLL